MTPTAEAALAANQATGQEVAVVYDRLREEEKLLFAAFDRLGVKYRPMYAPDLVLELGAEGAPLVALQRCTSQWRALSVAHALMAAGTLVINDPEVINTCGDKLATSAALVRNGVPTPRTVVALGRDGVLAAAELLGYPVVTKPLVGSWGRMVTRVADAQALEAVIEHREVLGGPEHKIHYLQEHVDKPGRDIRAFVVGNQVIAAIYRTSDHWLTNTARGAVASNCDLSPELIQVCQGAAQAVGGGILAIDLVESARGLLVIEVNHTMEFRNSITTTGVDIPGAMVAYAVSKLPVVA